MASVDGIDWMKHMQVSLLDQPGLADAYPNEWVKSRCRIAAEIALTESGNAEPRLNSGDLSEDTPAYDASPNLYVSKREKQLLDGYAEGHGPVGTIGVGLSRIYGL